MEVRIRLFQHCLEPAMAKREKQGTPIDKGSANRACTLYRETVRGKRKELGELRSEREDRSRWVRCWHTARPCRIGLVEARWIPDRPVLT